MNKIILVLVVITIFASCKTPKTTTSAKVPWYANDTLFKKYLVENRKIDKEGVITDWSYNKDYFSYHVDKDRKHILNNPYLKANKVYSYLMNNGNSYIFSVFADDGDFYTGTYAIDSEYLTATENGTIKSKQLVKLKRHGFFEIENDILKTSRHIRTRYKEWYENDTGYIKNDTLHFTAIYKSKKYEYKKKWLAKTHKTHFIHKYQPKLIATKIKDSRTGLDVYMVEGEFTAHE